MADYSSGAIPLPVQPPCSDLVVAQHETFQVLGNPAQLVEFHIRDNIWVSDLRWMFYTDAFVISALVDDEFQNNVKWHLDVK